MSVPSDRPGLVQDLFALVVADALVGIDLSLDEWIAVLDAHSVGFSMRRALFHEKARDQLAWIASGVAAEHEWDDVVGDGRRALAERIEALPTLQKIAILDVVDRYWGPRDRVRGGLREDLEALGVVFADTAHAKLRAAAARASWRR